MDFNALQDSLLGPGNSNLPNVTVESKYTLLEEIGRGSYGVVWKAKRRQGTQLFAIKQISKRRAGTKGLQEVIGEVETMSLLSHPNIVRLEDTFQDADCLWIVMEFLPGGELQQIIKSRELPEATARRIVSQLLMAVEYIHDKGVVHRDLKPANCLVTEGEDMVVKISDFGFAVMAGAEQCLSTYCGTIAFMAPEILQEHNYGKPVDMWALGVMTYYMVTGEYPFVGSTTAALRRVVCKGRCDLNTGRLHLFPLLRDFLAKLLVRDPHRRMTAKEALKHPWVKVGRENNAGTPVNYLGGPATNLAGGNRLLPLAPLAPGQAHGGNNGIRRHRVSARSRWRGAVVAVVAAHRLLYLQRCRRLTRLGFGHVRLLRDFHYAVAGRFEPCTDALDCSRMFSRSPDALLELLPMVQSCHRLVSLDLAHNNIDSLALVQALLKACGSHPSLRVLSLAHNPIPAVAGRGLLRLARNPASRVASLDLTDTLVPEDTASQIKTALKDKAAAGLSLSSPSSTPRFSASVMDASVSAFLSLPPPPPPTPQFSRVTSRGAVFSSNGKRSKSFDSSNGGLTSAAAPTMLASRAEKRHGYHVSRLPPLPTAAVSRRGGK